MVALMTAVVALGIASLCTIAAVRVAAAEQDLPNGAPPAVVGDFSQLLPAPPGPRGDANTRFEVAAIRPLADTGGQVMVRVMPGRFEATAPVGLLLRQALQKPDYQIVGAPAWIDTERYSISAKVPEGVPPTAVGVMLANLMKDRFQLATHVETRELPIFNLVVARSDRRLGPDLKVTSDACRATIEERLAATKAAAGRGEPPQRPPQGDPGGPPPCGLQRMGPGLAAGSGRPIADLAPTLADLVGRVVIDKTGLTGLYDFSLTFAPESARAPGIVRLLSPDAPTPAGGFTTPSLAAALQDQLGLKLEGARGPVEVVVIDRVEKPTPD